MKVIAQFAHTLWMNRLLKVSLILSGLFGLVHLLGFRTYTYILSGTGALTLWHIYCGTTYMLLYLGMVGIVPILFIAAALRAGSVQVKSLFRPKKHHR